MDDLIQIKKIPVHVLIRLLTDKTTGKNIIWATDSYENSGSAYEREKQIQLYQIQKPGFLQPRISKTLGIQKERTKKNAEVFTPAWVCNLMNSTIEQEWFDSKEIFNFITEKNWDTNPKKISFKKKTAWKSYVRNRVLEITCGEAPFIVSRYDSSTGEPIPSKDRIGILDRKLRVVNENTNNPEDWYIWAIKALKSVYGYEFQGDSLLLGRVNIYLTFAETMMDVWNLELTLKQQREVANIISWNVWQMDGLTDCIPIGVPTTQYEQPTLFGFLDSEENEEKNEPALPTKTYDWSSSRPLLIKEMKEGKCMKSKRWGTIIGNPPYQESDGGNKASAVPVYQKFISEAEKLNPTNMCLIIPDRWFAGGRGLDTFREKMKNDRHIKYLYDFQNASDCFPGVDISGGICYFIRHDNYSGPCEFINHGKILSSKTRYLNEFPVVVRSNEAVSILEKINDKGIPSLSLKVSSQKPFGLRTYVKPGKDGELVLRWNKGKGPIKRKEVTAGTDMIDRTKVIVSRVFFEHAGQANKDGTYRVLSILEILKPNEVCTETYVVIDSFDREEEAENLLKYLKTKFARFLILQAASSIMITKTSFLFVPQMDFSSDSYIDWNKTITEIDNQIASCFGLSKEESDMIDKTIKEME